MLVTKDKIVLFGTRSAAPLEVRSEHVVAAAFRPGTHDIALIRRPGDVSQVVLGQQVLFSTAGELRGLTWSPDGRWLLVGSPEADQWVFVRADGRKILAVSNVSDQFRTQALPARGRLVLRPVRCASCSGQATRFPTSRCGPPPVKARCGSQTRSATDSVLLCFYLWDWSPT